MSYDTCVCLYEKSLELPFFFINDIFITGFCADSCDIKRQHYEQGFSSVEKTIDKIASSDIVIHYMNETNKMLAYKKFQNLQSQPVLINKKI